MQSAGTGRAGVVAVFFVASFLAPQYCAGVVELGVDRHSRRVLSRWLQEPERVWTVKELLAPLQPEQRHAAENMIGWMAEAGWARCFWDPPQDVPGRRRRRCARLTDAGVQQARSLLAMSRPEGVWAALWQEGPASARLAWAARREERGRRRERRAIRYRFRGRDGW
jgi:hypothetical protein